MQSNFKLKYINDLLREQNKLFKQKITKLYDKKNRLQTNLRSETNSEYLNYQNISNQIKDNEIRLLEFYEYEYSLSEIDTIYWENNIYELLIEQKELLKLLIIEHNESIERIRIKIIIEINRSK
jgi:hypothetical protein